MTFADLRLAEPILQAVVAEGYTQPTPIQIQAIPHVLAGRDLLGCAQTGTGKTAAFALPILQRLSQTPPGHNQARKIRALVLSPTRELAAQIGESFKTYGRHTGLRQTVIYGGVGQNSQVQALRHGIDILVATPGRLLDLMGQGFIDLRNVEVFVLDEGDRMLDMGFIHDIRRIALKLPAKRQTMLFSATMPSEIRRLAGTLTHKPVEVSVAAESAAADGVEQFVYYVAKAEKPSLLRRLLEANGMERTLVFTRTKHGADRVVKQLRACGLRAEAIHGNKKQNARDRALASFKSAQPPVLVATDVASRGIDIDEISHVVNYDIPVEPESYVHRIGRTARAGATGVAFSFCDFDERDRLRAIERLIRQSIPVKGASPHKDAAGGHAASGHRSAHPHAGPAGHTRDAQQAHHAHAKDPSLRWASPHSSAVATAPARSAPRSQPGRGPASWPKHRKRTAGKAKHRRF